MTDIDAMCNRTMNRLEHLWSPDSTNNQAFNRLTESLLGKRKAETELNSTIAGSSSQSHSKLDEMQRSSFLYNPKAHTAPSLKKTKPPKSTTLGKGWFNLQPMEIDEKVKRDAKLIQLRNYIDPKRFYKNPDKNGKILHVGTVIEGPSEYFSARLTKKQRKQTITDEIIHDQQAREYTKKTFLNIQAEKSKKQKIFSKRKLRK